MQAEHYIESVLAKCEALKQSGLWATEPVIRPRAWLNNFTDATDRLIAASLLDNFIFFTDRASSRLLAYSFRRLEDDLLQGRVGTNCSVDELRFCPVEGESPRPTDSGNTICKRLRDVVELPDERFVAPDVALVHATAGLPVAFVDDFVGSGQQLIKTWERKYSLTTPRSFAEAYGLRPFPAFCIAIVATDTAIKNVALPATPVVLMPTHVLDESYSVEQLGPPPVVPPIANFGNIVTDFLRRHAAALTLPPFLQSDRQPMYGFHELGLLFALQGGVPDSTLPIVWAPGRNEWVRLVRKNG